MPHPARVLVLSVSTSSAFALLGGGVVSAQVQQPPSTGDRVLGLDVSAWQGNISQTTWNNIYNVEDREFVFIRSSRGGTTGYYNQSNPNNNNPPGQNTLSQRYDDPYYVQNITRATAAGMLAGSYHFSRPDIIESTLNSGGIRNNGTDEANHFIQMAGAWMRPGYLVPVHDLEAGISQRTRDELTQFSLDFSNRIYEVMGIRPAIYINGSYTDYLNGSSSALRTQLPTAYPSLWVARWPNQTNPDAIPVQTGHPKDTYANFYGPWNPLGAHPWHFWQYASTGRLQSFNNGGSNLDMNVAQGNIEFVKDQLVPAVWMNDSSGDWGALVNWNSGQDPIVPVQGDGQVARVGPLTLPTKRLPGQPDPAHTRVTGLDDNVNLNRPNANITVTLSSGDYNIRRLNLNERLNVTGGSLDARLTGQVGAGGTLSLSGGNVTFTEGYVNNGGVLDFSGAGTLNVGTLFLAGNPTFTGTGGTGQILPKAGVANPLINLLGGTRTFTVADGSAATDMRIAVPLSNGNFTKAGPGTLELTGNNSAYTGTLAVNGGHLRLTNANQIGTTGVRTNSAGSVRVDGNGLNFNRTIQLGGLGAGGVTGGGALENVSGSNTWSGNVLLAGTAHNHGQAGLNQIGAAAGSTLAISGVIQDNIAGVLRSWAKVGAGDVVLGGASPNTYTNLTRVFGGRIIIEKDAALGTTDQTQAAGSTIQLADANSAVAFRAPGGSAGFNYDAAEWIFTEGGGIDGAQLDNIRGANTFAGHIGVGGPVVNGTQEAYLGVSADSLEIKGGIHARQPVDGAAGAQVRNIFKRGNGTLILSGSNAASPTNSFARALADGSTFTIEAGTVQLKGTAGNGVNVAGVSRWNVNAGGLLSLSQGGAAGTADVRFNGGTLRAEQSMVAANSLTFTGNGTIDTAASVNATFSGNVSGSGNVTKSGSGNVFLGGPVNNFRGAVSVSGGILGVAQNGGDSGIANVNGISIGATARLDLADNDLIVRTTPASAVEGFVATGYAGGDWSGAGGIISSTAAANDWIYTLGVADNAHLGRSSFGGHTGLTGAETFVKYTYFGDADLSGAVNAADFARFRAGFAGEMDAAWTFGDFDYSGVVDGRDFELYLFGFLNQPSIDIPNTFYDDLTTFAIDNGFDPTMVPEPTGVALLALGAGLLMRRGRRV